MTGFPDNRSKFWRKVTDIENDEMDLEREESDDETEVSNVAVTKRLVKLPGKSGYYEETINVHDRYAARPQSTNPDVHGRLEKICLAQFSTSYTFTNKVPRKVEFDEDGCSKNISS